MMSHLKLSAWLTTRKPWTSSYRKAATSPVTGDRSKLLGTYRYLIRMWWDIIIVLVMLFIGAVINGEVQLASFIGLVTIAVTVMSLVKINKR
jgi:hypothetical protein